MVRKENVKRRITVMKKKVDPIRSRLQLLRTVCRVYANEKLISDWAVKVKLGEQGECQHGRFLGAVYKSGRGGRCSACIVVSLVSGQTESQKHCLLRSGVEIGAKRAALHTTCTQSWEERVSDVL